MGFLDKFKKQGAELKDKAADLAASQNDNIDKGIDKAADLANKATKGKYDEQIDSAADKAKDAVDELAEGDKPHCLADSSSWLPSSRRRRAPRSRAAAR